MARSFNGSTDKIVTANYTNPSPAATLFAWVYPTSFTPSYSGVAGPTSGGNVFQILVKSSTHAAYYVEVGITNVSVDPGSLALSTNTWTSLGFSYDGTNGLATYANGASDGTAAAIGGSIATASAGFAIGWDELNAGRNFAGRIAHVAQWNTNLTAREHLALGKGALPLTIRPGNLVGYWPLDGLQSPEPDLSGKALNGTLTGTALAAGPPVMMFTPRWPQTVLGTGVAANTVFRRTLSSIGTRVGSRQTVNS